ncbi:hypothetical protein GCK72_007934 [Caenorhabditis remanei]|uniref:PHD-type domain-containing protein n=1 Tax=Caenorhabditis remanei TaxID=31234 RepID=A0A6A5HNQ2_CAERE|nr:hypothetical protein GCK72_007934 [Caenorhabditis remanei]KAF1767973.1 hypothetical protein GCK72_007934 [Caenorhabditis remanei]
MTNMQHYLDDIQDLLDGLNEEMAKRLHRISKWDDQYLEKSSRTKQLEDVIFDATKSMDERKEAVCQLAGLRDDIREIAEKKTNLAEKNHETLTKVVDKISELAYHCKCEIEIDNPGSTEQRERQFYRSLSFAADLISEYHGSGALTAQNLMDSLPPRNGGKREASVLTDDDRTSTRSVTPFGGARQNKKRPGRPRNTFKMSHFEKIPETSNASSCRSSVDPDVVHARAFIAENAQKKKKLSKYMRKKQEKLRKAEEDARRIKNFEVKKEVDTGDYEDFALSQWGDDMPSSRNTGEGASASSALIDVCEEDDEQELLDCLIGDFADLPSPPKGIMEALDVTESGLYSMDMYPPGHKSQQNTPEKTQKKASGEFRHPGNSMRRMGGGADGPSSSNGHGFNLKRANNGSSIATMASESTTASASLFSDPIRPHHHQQNQRVLFGTIADTSFSGRPRKLTDRVTEMIQSNRERSQKSRTSRDEAVDDEWCICNGANTNSDMMVECENPNCLKQWFHFDCVGLSSPPDDEWFCPDCSPLPTFIHHSSSSRRHD